MPRDDGLWVLLDLYSLSRFAQIGPNRVTSAACHGSLSHSRACLQTQGCSWVTGRLHVHALPAHACAWDVRWAVPSCHGLDIWLNRGAAFRAGSLLVFNLQLILNAPKLLACSVSRLSTISLPRIVLGRLWGSPDFILVPKNNRLALSCCITHHMVRYD